MTDKEINAMPAGHELDVLIAENVMGCTARVGDEDWYYCGCPDIDGKLPHGDRKASRPIVGAIKRYSTKIADAWLVVEKIEGLRTRIQMAHPLDLQRCSSLRRWECWLGNRRAFASTAPLAICHAALQVVLQQNYHDFPLPR